MTKSKESVIEDRTDRLRGYGWRKPGAVYIVAKRIAICGKLPIVLDVCPTCGGGFKPTSRWTWVNGTALAGPGDCGRPKCRACPLVARGWKHMNQDLVPPDSPLLDQAGIGRCGLLWIGVRHYPRPADWLAEAAAQGIALRLAAIPQDFEVGKLYPPGIYERTGKKTRVMVAHRKAILGSDETYTAAIFAVFLPWAVEYVVRDDETPDQLAALARRGVRLVRVRRVVDTPMFGTLNVDRPHDRTGTVKIGKGKG